MKRISSINHAGQEVYEWLNEINKATGWKNTTAAYAALRATLRLLRDNLTLEGSAKLATKLPPLIRGIFYENWHPVDQPLRERAIEDFLQNLSQLLEDYNHSELDPELAATSVFKTLMKKVDKGEAHKIYSQLPKGIKKIFPTDILTKI